MNKKFLSAILFGALMVTSTGTFVSCKDYDDDIENLQSQINNLATKSDVEAKLAQLQAALEAAKAESSANAAKIAAIKQCQCDVEAMMKKIQDAVDADMQEFANEINALIEQAEAIVGEIADYVTSVELVSSHAAGASLPLALDFYTVTEKENVFEENIAGAIEFVDGKQTNVGQTPILVRVSPTNAVLSPEMISLVNSKGENLDEYLDVTVAPYSGLLTRAAENNGLWEVKFTLKEYDSEKYADLQATEDGTILYAVQVNNALASEETASRYVTSSYDVTLGEHTDFKAVGTLNFEITDANGIAHNIATVNNRYSKWNNPSLPNGNNYSYSLYEELTWNPINKTATEAILTGEKKNVQKNGVDNRADKPVVLAVQGEPIKISIVEEDASKIAAIYVTLDKEENAVESAPSEWNAWNSYTYTGLNTVVENTSTEITISGEETINDYIGFRVYAVNYDGTLVDPDGRAFYVLVGEQAQDWSVAATAVTPVSETIVQTEKVSLELAEVRPAKVTWTMDEENVPFKIFMYEKNATSPKFALGNGGDEEFNYPAGFPTFDKYVAVTAQPASGKAWTDYKDGQAYYGTLTAYDATGFVIATLRVSFTKNIPTTAPEGFSIKTTQVVDGIHNSYLIPSDVNGAASWTSATYGAMAMDQIFNMPADLKANYEFTFATSEAKDGEYTEPKKVKGNASIIVNKDLIDNTTKHATTATYNYGKISSEAKDAEGKNIVDYVVEVPEVNFETVYNCIYNDTYSWAWATREQLHAAYPNSGWNDKEGEEYKNAVPELVLTYNKEYSLSVGIDYYIMGVSEVYSRYNAPLAKSYEGSLTIKSATFTSDANGNEEYFKPEFDSAKHITKLAVIPNNQNVTADVPSTLTIVVVDMYGHEREIKIPAVVKKN